MLTNIIIRLTCYHYYNTHLLTSHDMVTIAGMVMVAEDEGQVVVVGIAVVRPSASAKAASERSMK
jgi:hypothetical protein